MTSVAENSVRALVEEHAGLEARHTRATRPVLAVREPCAILIGLSERPHRIAA